MAIAPGTRIGPYEVAALIGAGGMGQVYRARDTRLRRDVALKVLPVAVATDSERQRRFEQEALAIARLDHPNVLAVHDLGAHEGCPYIVTELLEGETLRAKMRGQPIAPHKAIEYGIHIARGLAAAHERDVVHRDVKPDNVLVTRDGRVKILDFGLARLTDPEAAASGEATVTIAGIGPVVGTAAYMAPEQARGLRVDHRADVFSLGVLLYEMLSGVSPFRRDTTADTISAILNHEPEPFDTATPLAPAIDRVVRHCLEKDPENRFQSARDLAFDLEALLHATAPVPVQPQTRRSSAIATVGPWLVAFALGGAAGYLARGGAGGGAREAVGVPRIQRVTEFAGFEELPSVSPDGKAVAFSAYVDGRRQIFVRLIAAGAPLQLTRGASDHTDPRWSPDSSSLMYFSPATPGDAQGTIWEIPALGGSPRRVVDSMGGCDMSRAGRLACFRLAAGRIELVTLARDGSDARVVHRPESRPAYHRYPRWSPDARSIAFQRGDGVRYDVFTVPANGGPLRQLTHDNSQISGLAWRPDSTGIVYSSSRGSTVPYLPTLHLWSIGLEDDAPAPLMARDLSYVHPDITPSGTIAAARVHMAFDIWKFPADADAADNVRRAERVTRQTGQVQTPTNGPADTEIAFLSDSGGHANLWVLETATGDLRQITHERDPAVALGVPVWSPDGKEIAFVSSRGNTGFGFGIWTVNPDGGNLRSLVKRGLGMAWAPDSSWLYYADAGVFWKIPRAGGTPVRVRAEETRNAIAVHASTVYFMVDRALLDGRPEFEIRVATPEDGPSRAIARVPASRLPGWQIANPALSPDGSWLAVPLTDGVTTNIWAVSTATGAWRQITDFGARATFIARRVTWSSDGRAIYAAVGEGDADIVLLEGLLNPPR